MLGEHNSLQSLTTVESETTHDKFEVLYNEMDTELLLEVNGTELVGTFVLSEDDDQYYFKPLDASTYTVQMTYPSDLLRDIARIQDEVNRLYRGE